MTGNMGVYIGCGLFALYVVMLMVVEGISYRKDRPPQERSDGPVTSLD